MKKILAILFGTSLFLSACAPATPAVETLQETATVAATEEAQAEPQAALTVQETPLPAAVEAPIIDAPAIINIDMLDEVYGWGITESEVVRTNDGGVTWYNVSPPGLSEAGYFIYADFFDAEHAWLQLPDMNNQPNGGTLYRTSDGGLTWESFATPFSDGSLQFIDDQNGWMMANRGAGAGSNAISIFKTRDGGETWERTYTNDPSLEGAADSLPLGGLKNFLIALDENTAWVGGVVYAPGQTYLFRSDDRGVTWSNINLVLPEGTNESELSMIGIVFVSPQEGLLALRVTSETPETIVYATQDGGTTWEQLPVNFEGYGKLSTPSESEIIFYNADQFYVTKDAGRSIQQVSPDVSFGDSIIDMSFANATTGWVITDELILYKTTDGGATWTVLIR
jgi:photosystem II stability/assembly factor-like uncharacterized protein